MSGLNFSDVRGVGRSFAYPSNPQPLFDL